MSAECFEGPAGTGKTHNLIQRALELVNDDILGEHSRLLALTFMNGARRRLQSHLSQHGAFRRRFECQTFDVFARTLASRRRGLTKINPDIVERADALNEFDGPCFVAASLLEHDYIAQWVTASFPLVLVDEAQDLDEYRLHILQGLAGSSCVVAAADEFQCLADGRDTSAVMAWLETAGKPTRLTAPMRTSQPGLLEASRAVRDGQDIRAVLTQSARARNATWYGQGFRLLEIHAKNSGLVAWAIANEISQRTGPTAILTPDSKSPLIREAINAVSTREWTRKSGDRFGPYPCAWEVRDSEIANALLDQIALPKNLIFDDAIAALGPFEADPAIANVMNRLDRTRRVRGQDTFSRADIAERVRAAVRDQSRLGLRRGKRHAAMTIQRAKNREFQNVMVLWPHSATGSSEHLRRLLYNAITRAKNHCSVIVLGQGRLNGPPFAPDVGV